MNIVRIYKKFPTEKDCIAHLEAVRWKGKPTCPYCKASKFSPMKKEGRYHCNGCNTSFSVTVATIFHRTHIDLQKWFLGISLILNARKRISARQLARDLEVNKNTAWFMAMRIRRAMMEQKTLLEGIVEADETYIGTDKEIKDPKKRGRETSKQVVFGLVQRGGRVMAMSLKNISRKTLSSLIDRNIDASKAKVNTDEFTGYFGLSNFVEYQTVKHKEWYVNGDVHTNNIERFWAFLKFRIAGQFHKVSLKHLEKYVDEFCYRHNNRLKTDLFGSTLIRAIEGVA
jgi:transposase-like protein